MFGFKKKTICQRTSNMLSEYIDGRLDRSDVERVESHVADCDICSTDLESLRATVGLIKAVSDVPTPRSFALDPGKVTAPQSEQLYGQRVMRWLRPGLAVSVVLFVVMLFVDLIVLTPLADKAGTRGTAEYLSSFGGSDWGFVFKIFEWGWGAVVMAFVIAFLYVTWRRRRGLPNHDDFTDLLH